MKELDELRRHRVDPALLRGVIAILPRPRLPANRGRAARCFGGQVDASSLYTIEECREGTWRLYTVAKSKEDATKGLAAMLRCNPGGHCACPSSGGSKRRTSWWSGGFPMATGWTGHTAPTRLVGQERS